MKSYNSKSSARRALKAIGAFAADAADTLIKEVNGKFAFDEDEANRIQAEADAQMDAATPELTEIADGGLEAQSAGPEEQETSDGEDDHPEMNQGDAVANNLAVADATPAGQKVIKRQSETERPCKTVFHLADHCIANGMTKRVDIIQYCVDHGIAYYTARTQYQNWYSLEENKTKVREAKLRAATTEALTESGDRRQEPRAQ